jgi:hypothetical protein
LEVFLLKSLWWTQLDTPSINTQQKISLPKYVLKMAVFWVVAPCSLVEVYHFRGTCCLHHQGGSKYIWNIAKLLPDYTALQPRRQPSSCSLPWKPQIIQNLSYLYYNFILLLVIYFYFQCIVLYITVSEPTLYCNHLINQLYNKT